MKLPISILIVALSSSAFAANSSHYKNLNCQAKPMLTCQDLIVHYNCEVKQIEELNIALKKVDWKTDLKVGEELMTELGFWNYNKNRLQADYDSQCRK